jgi:hypothetical protein
MRSCTYWKCGSVGQVTAMSHSDDGILYAEGFIKCPALLKAADE